MIKTIRECVEDVDNALISIRHEVDETEKDIDRILKNQASMQLQLDSISKAVADLTSLVNKIAAELVPPAVTPGVPVQIVFTLGTAVQQ